MSTWVQLGQTVNGDFTGDDFGWSCRLNAAGTRVVVSARYSDEGGTDSGQVKVFDLSGNVWYQLGQTLVGAAGDFAGVSVSMNGSGSRIAIAYYGSDINGANAGDVKLFDLSGNTWTQVGQTIVGEAAGDLATTVALNYSGSIIAYGSHGNDGGGSNAGSTRVFEYNGSSWVKLGQDIDGEAGGDNSGSKLSINDDGTIVAIGAGNNDGSGSNAGHVRVYQYNGSSWTDEYDDARYRRAKN
jgi:hypothetical protein